MQAVPCLLKCAAQSIQAACRMKEVPAAAAGSLRTRRRQVQLYQILRDGVRGFGGEAPCQSPAAEVRDACGGMARADGSQWRRVWSEEHCMYQACASICGSGDSGVGAEGLVEAARAMRQALQQAEADLGSLVAKHAAWCERMACGPPARGKETKDKETTGETKKGEAAPGAVGAGAGGPMSAADGPGAVRGGRLRAALESIAGLLAEVDDVTSVLGGLGKEQQEAQASGVVLVEVDDDDEIAGIGVHGAAGQQGRGRKMLAKVLAAAKARDEGACASGKGQRKGNEQGPASPRKSCSAQRGRPASSRRRGAPAATEDAGAGVVEEREVEEEAWGVRMRRTRIRLVGLLQGIAALVPPGGAEALPMHEAVVFKSVADLGSMLQANPRRSVHEGLTFPEDFHGLRGQGEGVPDASRLYQLSLAEGRRLSMAEWFSSFSAQIRGQAGKDELGGGAGAQGVREHGGRALGVGPRKRVMKGRGRGKDRMEWDEEEGDDDDEARKEEQALAMTQARFMYAVTELQVLGPCQRASRDGLAQ